MSKTQEQKDEEFFMSIRDTVDDMFMKLFPSKMFCEVESETKDTDDEDDKE